MKRLGNTVKDRKDSVAFVMQVLRARPATTTRLSNFFEVTYRVGLDGMYQTDIVVSPSLADAVGQVTTAAFLVANGSVPFDGTTVRDVARNEVQEGSN